MAANKNAISTRLEPSSAGQRAHDLRLGPQPEYVDATRSHLNRILIEPLTNDQLRAEWLVVKNQVGKHSKLRSNQNLSYSGIVTFGVAAQPIFEALSIEQQNAAIQEVTEKIAGRFNTRLTGLVFHGDETAPHFHYQLRGIANGGTMLSQVVKRAALRETQDIAAEVMQRHAAGIERGKSIMLRRTEGESYADTVNRSVKRLHADLPAEIAAKEAELAQVQAKLDKNAGLLSKARAELEKTIEENGAENAKAEKIRKRAAIYEKRTSDAQAELDRLTAQHKAAETALVKVEGAKARATDEVTSAKSALTRIAEEKAKASNELDDLNSAMAQKKTNIDNLRARRAALEASLQSLNAP